jgi:hypothetical protein
MRVQVISAPVSSRPCSKNSYTNTNTDQWITKAMHNSSELERISQNTSSRFISLAADTLRGRAWPVADNANVLNEDLGFPTLKYRFLIYGEDLQDPHEGCWGCSWQMQSYYALPPVARMYRCYIIISSMFDSSRYVGGVQIQLDHEQPGGNGLDLK